MSIDSTGSVRYYHPDERGSVRTITDAQGNVLETHLYKPYGQEYSQTGSTPFLKYRFNDRRDEGCGLLRWPLRNFNKESYHWTAFDPVACVAPDALVADGSNFFAYCGYDPVNCTDPMGGFKVPRPIPLPDDGKEKDAEEWEMPVEAVTVHRPSDSASTQTSVDDILDEVPVSSWAPKPPTLPDMREADCSGNGPQERVVSPGPDVATRHDIGMVQVAEVFIPGRLPPIFRWFGGPKSSRIPRGAPVIQRMYRNPGPPPIKNAPRTMSPNLNIPKSTPGFQLLRLIDQVLRFLNNLPQPPPGTNMIPAIHTLPDVDKCGPGECIIGSYPAKVSDIVV